MTSADAVLYATQAFAVARVVWLPLRARPCLLRIWALAGTFIALHVASVVACRCGSHRWHILLVNGGTALILAALLVALLGSHDDGWKRLWGKLKSAALTAVNAARFNQQVKEATS